MASLRSHGRLEDPPWGRTLATLALRQATAVVDIVPDTDSAGRQITLVGGLVVDARSPFAEDDAAGVVMSSQLADPASAGRLRAAIAAAPERDEIEVVAEAAGLDAEAGQRLRRRVLAQRAVRSFGIERGTFEVTETERRDAAVAIEVHPIVYLGALLHLSVTQLRRALDDFGIYFRLAGDASATLGRFGFTQAEVPILAGMRNGVTVGELLASQRPREQHEVLAVLYALACCQTCEVARQPFGQIRDGRLRSRVNSKVSFKTKPKAVAPLPVSAPASAPLPLLGGLPSAPTPAAAPPASPPPAAAPSDDDEPEMVVEIEPPDPGATALGTGHFAPDLDVHHDGFDLAAALSAELGDEPLAFEQGPEGAGERGEDCDRADTAVMPAVTEPPDGDDSAADVVQLATDAAAPVDDGSQDARPIARAIKRTEQLLAFVAVPRRPAKR